MGRKAPNGWFDIASDDSDPQHDVGAPEPGPTNRTWWLVGATAAAVLACLAITYLLLRAIFPTAEPMPTIPWGTLTPAQGLATQVPLASPTPAPDCVPDAEYVDDVTAPDNVVVAPGAAFLKAWRVRNSGTCPWVAGYTLRFSSGEQMGGPASISVPAAQPGETAELSVSLVAPEAQGVHRGNWQLCASDATCFGPVVYVQIVVAVGATPSVTLGAAATPSATPATPSATPSPEPSPSTLPPSPGASEWLVHGNRALGIREIAWDTSLNGFTSSKGEIYLSLYIVGMSTDDSSAIFSPLEISVIDGDGRTHETLILERKDPPFALCTAGPGATCEGWWTTAIADRTKTRRALTLRWEPSLLSAPLETPIRQ